MHRTIVALATILIVALAGAFAFWPSRPPQKVVAGAPAAATASAVLETPAQILSTRGREALLAAMQDYRAAIARGVDPLPAYNALGNAYMLLGKLDDAQRTLIEGLAKSPKPAADARTRDIEDAVHLRTSLANVFLSRGEFPRAQALLEEVVSISPRDAAAHNNLANALFVQGKFEEANRQYEFATVLQPENPETYSNWGSMLYQANRFNEAEAKFRRAIALKKDAAKYHYWLGRVLRKEGRIGSAIKSLDAACRADDKMVEPRLELGSIYVDLNQLREAEGFFRGALLVDKDNLEATVNLARVLLASKQKDKCLDAAFELQKANAATHDKDPNLLAQMAEAYALSDSYEQADETITKALAAAAEKHNATRRELFAALASVWPCQPPRHFAMDTRQRMLEILGHERVAARDREILMQHQQEFVFLKNKRNAVETEAGPITPLTAVGADALLPAPENANPYDIPEKPRVVGRVIPPAVSNHGPR